MPDNHHESDLAVNFGKRLKYLRQMKKMTQSELGDKIGLSRRQIGRIENGESSPQFSILEKLCQALDANIIQLFLFQEESGSKQEKVPARVDTEDNISDNFLIQPSLIGLWSISNATAEMSWTQGVYEFLEYSKYSVKPTLIRFLKRVDTRDKQLLINFFDTIHSPSHPQKILIRLTTKKSAERIALIIKESTTPEEDIQMVILDVTEVQKMHSQLLLNTEQLEKSVKVSNIKLTRAVAELKHELQLRRQTEQSLRESEEAFRTLAEKCPVSIFRFDRQGRVNFVNDWHMEKFALNKLDKKYFMNKSVHELLGLVKAGKDDEVAKIFKGEYVEIDEVFFPEFAAGSSGWVSIRAVPIYRKGEITGGILIRHNITDRKNLEKALQEKTRLLEAFLDNTPDVMSVKNPDLSVVRYNKNGYTLLNQTREQTIGKKCYELVGKEMPCPGCACLEAINRKEPVVKEKFIPEMNVWFSCRANPVISDNGQVEYVVEIISDITKEVRGREQMKFNNHFRELMTELSARFVQIVDTKTFNDAVDYTLASLGQLFEVDRSYLLRFSQDLSTMSNTHEWFAPGAAEQIHRIQQFPTSNMPWFMSWMVELRPMHIPDVSALPDEGAAEREEFEFQDTKSLLCLPIYDEHKKLLGFMGFDVVRSHHNWSEEQIAMLQMLAEILGSVIVRLDAMRSLAINKERLQKVNDEKDRLFAIIGHDLMSPLSGVFSTSEILAKEPESLSLQEIRHISAAMHKSSMNALELLEDLLQWARVSQESMDFSPEECSLYELARSSLYTALDIAEKKDITIQADIQANLTVIADQAMINTVLRNVIFNAVKFTHPGGNILLTARKTGPFIEVCTRDNGIGMCEKIMSSVFSVDTHKRQTGTDGEKGTGMGLILCREFVEKHGGQIWVESEPDKGTKVYFTLPAQSEERSRARG